MPSLQRCSQSIPTHVVACKSQLFAIKSSQCRQYVAGLLTFKFGHHLKTVVPPALTPPFIIPTCTGRGVMHCCWQVLPEEELELATH